MGDGEMATAVFPFQAQEDGDLSLAVGDVIKLSQKDESGWWTGKNLTTGETGDFPYNYVKIVSPGELKVKNAVAQEATQEEILKEAKVSSNPNSTSFSIQLTTSTKTLSGTKSLSDFRSLENDLRIVLPSIDLSLPPMWADKYYVTEALSTRRAAVIQAYLGRIVSSKNALAQYSLVTWLQPKTSFKISEQVKQDFETRVVKSRAKFGHSSMKIAFSNVAPLALVKYDWDPADLVELQLIKGEVIAIKSKNTQSEGWWEGETADGQHGLFPANYIGPLTPDQARDVILGDYKPSGSSLKKEKKERISKADKRKEENFAVPTFDAFEAVVKDGYCMLKDRNDFRSKASVKAKAGDEIVLNYVGYIWDCQKQWIYEFSNSDTDGDLKFVVNKGQVVEGLELAVRRMGQGESARIIVAPKKGYGDVGKPPQIAPNVHLVYDINISSITEASVPGPPKSNNKVAHREGTSIHDLAGAFADASGDAGGRSLGSWAPVHNRQTRKHNENKPKTTLKPIHTPKPPTTPKLPGTPIKYDLKTLQEVVRTRNFEQYKVDPGYIENHLKENEFAKAFKCNNLDQFLQYPMWKQAKLKRDVKLF